jgi:hypothetical protein
MRRLKKDDVLYSKTSKKTLLVLKVYKQGVIFSEKYSQKLRNTYGYCYTIFESQLTGIGYVRNSIKENRMFLVKELSDYEIESIDFSKFIETGVV